MSNGQLVRVVSALVTHQGKILLLLRDNIPSIEESNCWQLPGGGVEVGDSSPEDAIKRELSEEIGLVPSVLRFIIVLPPDTFVYYAPLTDSEAQNIHKGEEGQRLSFFSLDELNKIALTTKFRGAMRKHSNELRALLKQ